MISTMPSLKVLLQLGRVSNLPTVWTNTLAAAMLSGVSALDARLPALLVAMSLFYIGGMYLNDAFDAEIDARERPGRPIPAGLINRRTVFTAGFGLLATGLFIVLAIGAASGFAAAALLSGLGLAAAIVAYDVHHKQNPLSPLVMGICRVMVYVATACAVVGAPNASVGVGAALLLCYLIGLTYVAKQETLGRVANMWPLAFLAAPVVWGLATGLASANMLQLLLVASLAAWIVYAIRLVLRRGPGDIPRAVVSLIAGISLVDALLIASIPASAQIAVALAILAFALTLFLQRYIAGT